MANTTNTATKVSELPTAANVALTDRVLVLRNPASSPSVRTVNVDIFAANAVASVVVTNFRVSNAIPANSTAQGTKGTLAYSNTHLYVCVEANTWVRATLTSW